MNGRSGRRAVVAAVIVALALILLVPLFYCVGIPVLTGQVCYDFLSGHVPPRALGRFLDRLFEATVAEDYGWLATVSEGEALRELRDAQPWVTTGYEVVLRDNLLGLYEYRIRFESGATVYITLEGHWPSCPDFWVSEQEVFEHIQLTSIRVESD